VAVVTLMSYPDTPLTGRVESIGWGIAPATAAPTVVCMLPVFLALGGMNLRTDQNLFLGWFEPRMTQSETWLSVVSVRGFIFGVYFFDCHSKGRS
jgi:hypothetical protein